MLNKKEINFVKTRRDIYIQQYLLNKAGGIISNEQTLLAYVIDDLNELLNNPYRLNPKRPTIKA